MSAIFIFIISLLYGQWSFAFTPDVLTILRKYSKTQTPQNMIASFNLKDTQSGLSWREVWHTESGGLKVYGLNSASKDVKSNVMYTFFYSTDFKKLKTQSPNNDSFLEPLFFHRSSEVYIRQFILFMNFLPPSSFLPATISNIKTYVPVQSPLVKVSRCNGLICLALSSSYDLSQGPILWLDQDEFLPQKIKLPGDTLLTITAYSSKIKNFLLPKTRLYQWEKNSVEIALTDARVNKSSEESSVEKPTNEMHSPVLNFVKKFR